MSQITSLGIEQLQSQEHIQALDSDTYARQVFSDVQAELATSDIDVAWVWEAVEQMPENHVRWKLEAVNSTYEQTQHVLNAFMEQTAQTELLKSAVTLAAHKLPREQISGMGLPPQLFDESSDVSSVDLKDVILMGRAWDNSGRNPIVQDLLEKMTDQLDDGNTGESAIRNQQFAIFYKAQRTGITYKEALLQKVAEGNDIDVYSKVGQKLIRLYNEKRAE